MRLVLSYSMYLTSFVLILLFFCLGPWMVWTPVHWLPWPPHGRCLPPACFPSVCETAPHKPIAPLPKQMDRAWRGHLMSAMLLLWQRQTRKKASERGGSCVSLKWNWKTCARVCVCWVCLYVRETLGGMLRSSLAGSCQGRQPRVF